MTELRSFPVFKAAAWPAIACAILILAGCGRTQPLAPDLAFEFRCTGAAFPASESRIESFLSAHGFTVFNEERVRRQYKLSLYPLQIDGYDGNHRMLDFRGINDKVSDKPNPVPAFYAVGLYSRPPTHHDAALEAAMLDFATKTLKCDVSHVGRGSNDADRAAFFDDIYQREQSRIAEGRKCDKASGKPLDTHCPS